MMSEPTKDNQPVQLNECDGKSCQIEETILTSYCMTCGAEEAPTEAISYETLTTKK